MRPSALPTPSYRGGKKESVRRETPRGKEKEEDDVADKR